ncbi:MAG: hypothetical protein CFE44_13670 [Burkholderiales bacterium PBB4]|nr:MAG: hypothetical protein CFE44_13670 [Burkholderiales bacterium PBB4]
MSYILGISASGHDASACLYDGYHLIAAVPLERLTRVKSEGGRVPTEAIKEVLSIGGIEPRDLAAVALSRSHFPIRYFKHDGFPLAHRVRRGIETMTGGARTVPMAKEARVGSQADVGKIFHAEKFLRDQGLPEETPLYFYDHHFAHVLPTLFHSPDWQDALLFSADGGSETGYYSMRYFHDGRMDTVIGGEEMLFKDHPVSSLALAYGFATLALGYKINRHEGKLTGLAARGEPKGFEALRARFKVESSGEISTSFGTNQEMSAMIHTLAAGMSPEDMACTIQKLVEVVVMESMERMVKLHPTRHLGGSGGLFANVRLNQVLADSGLFDSVFVCPPMSDQGIAMGGVLQYLLERDGLPTWLGERRVLSDMYLGRDYTTAVDEVFGSHAQISGVSGDPIETCVDAIIAGDAVGIFTGRMEFGPRALGTRSIIAAPVEAGINDSLNARMDRSEFMPFAPVILEEHADEVLHLPPQSRYSARFMTITCQVREEWKSRIPAVVHVAGTARPQLISRDSNPLYYDILKAYYERTGIPVLVNTSFNVHEEPIINTPAECLKALVEDRVDAVVTTQGFYRAKAKQVAK